MHIQRELVRRFPLHFGMDIDDGDMAYFVMEQNGYYDAIVLHATRSAAIVAIVTTKPYVRSFAV